MSSFARRPQCEVTLRRFYSKLGRLIPSTQFQFPFLPDEILSEALVRLFFQLSCESHGRI